MQHAGCCPHWLLYSALLCLSRKTRSTGKARTEWTQLTLSWFAFFFFLSAKPYDFLNQNSKWKRGIRVLSSSNDAIKTYVYFWVSSKYFVESLQLRVMYTKQCFNFLKNLINLFFPCNLDWLFRLQKNLLLLCKLLLTWKYPRKAYDEVWKIWRTLRGHIIAAPMHSVKMLGNSSHWMSMIFVRACCELAKLI